MTNDDQADRDRSRQRRRCTSARVYARHAGPYDDRWSVGLYYRPRGESARLFFGCDFATEGERSLRRAAGSNSCAGSCSRSTSRTARR